MTDVTLTSRENRLLFCLLHVTRSMVLGGGREERKKRGRSGLKRLLHLRFDSIELSFINRKNKAAHFCVGSRRSTDEETTEMQTGPGPRETTHSHTHTHTHTHTQPHTHTHTLTDTRRRGAKVQRNRTAFYLNVLLLHFSLVGRFLSFSFWQFTRSRKPVTITSLSLSLSLSFSFSRKQYPIFLCSWLHLKWISVVVSVNSMNWHRPDPSIRQVIKIFACCWKVHYASLQKNELNWISPDWGDVAGVWMWFESFSAADVETLFIV